MLSSTCHSDHITPVLHDLHWLPVKYRIGIKILLISFKAKNNLAPPYLSENSCANLFCHVTPFQNLYWATEPTVWAVMETLSDIKIIGEDSKNKNMYGHNIQTLQLDLFRNKDQTIWNLNCFIKNIEQGKAWKQLRLFGCRVRVLSHCRDRFSQKC